MKDIRNEHDDRGLKKRYKSIAIVFVTATHNNGASRHHPKIGFASIFFKSKILFSSFASCSEIDFLR